MNPSRRGFIVSAFAGLGLVMFTGCQAGSVAPQSPRTLRVLTYNIHHGEGVESDLPPGPAKVSDGPQGDG
jgi:hypothetical protein